MWMAAMANSVVDLGRGLLVVPCHKCDGSNKNCWHCEGTGQKYARSESNAKES